MAARSSHARARPESVLQSSRDNVVNGLFYGIKIKIKSYWTLGSSLTVAVKSLLFKCPRI